MAHLIKYTRTQLGHILKHYERAKDENGNYLKFGNTDIKPDKTFENYNLAVNQTLPQFDFIQKRCSEVHCLKRKDVNVMCSWIVTLPESLKNGSKLNDTKKFFKSADETTPHMHFSFVPIIFDKKKKRETVSAFALLNKTELKAFHGELSRHLHNNFGFDVEITNGIIKKQGENKSIEALKSETERFYQEKIDEATKKAEEILAEAKKIRKQQQKDYDEGIAQIQIYCDFTKKISRKTRFGYYKPS